MLNISQVKLDRVVIQVAYADKQWPII